MKRIISVLLILLFFSTNSFAADDKKPGQDSFLTATEYLKIKDYSNALINYKIAAKKGHPEAQYYLGTFYISGQLVKQDLTLGFQWLKKSAEQNNPYAQLLICKLYLRGHGVKKDINQAFIWCKKSAELGHREAQYILGAFFSEGIGVEKNPKQSDFWIHESAKRGYPPAMFLWGRSISKRNSDRSYKDLINSCSHEISKAWIDSAAYSGYTEAVFYKAFMKSGNQIPNHDWPKGYAWCRIYFDKKSGNKKQNDYLKKSFKEMTDEMTVYQKNEGEVIYKELKDKINSYKFDYSAIKATIDQCEKKKKKKTNQIQINPFDAFKPKKKDRSSINKKELEELFLLAFESRKKLEADNIESMLSEISKMKNPVKDKFCALIATGFFLKGDTDSAIKSIGMIDSKDLKSKILELIIANILQKNEAGSAIKIFSEIKDEKIKPALSSQISKHLKDQDDEKNLKIFRNHIPEDHVQYLDDRAHIFNEVKSGRVVDALKFIVSSEEKKQSEFYIILTEALIKNENFTSAKQIIETFSGKYKEIKKDSMYMLMAEKYLETGKIDEAVKITDKISNESSFSFCIRNMARKSGEKGDVVNSIKFIEKMRSQYRADSALRKLAEFWMRKGDEKKAMAFISKISLKERKKTFASISAIFARKGDIEKALKYFELINDKYLINGPLLALGEAYCKKGQIEKAKSAFEKINPGSYEKDNLKIEINMALAGALKKEGKEKEQEELILDSLKAIRNADFNSNNRYRNAVLRILDELDSNSKYYSNLIDLISILSDESVRSETLAVIMLHKEYKNFFKEMFSNGSQNTWSKTYPPTSYYLW